MAEPSPAIAPSASPARTPARTAASTATRSSRQAGDRGSARVGEAWHAVKICGVCGHEQELGIDAEGDIVYAT